MDQRFETKQAADFFRTEYQKLVGFVKKRIGDLYACEAEDLVQDIAVNLFYKAHFSAPIEDLSAYVYGSLKNALIDFFRKKKDTIPWDQPLPGRTEGTLADVVHDARPDALSEMERRERAEQLYRALDGLKEEERALIIATELEGRSFASLSAAWDVPINTLLSRKARALRKIRKGFVTAQADGIQKPGDRMKKPVSE